MVTAISSQVQKAITENPHLRAPQEEIQKCVQVARMLQHRVPQQLFITQSLKNAIHSLLVALERFLMKLGLIQLFQKVVSPSEIDSKGQDMVLLSTVFSTLTSTLIPVLGAFEGGMMIGGIFSTLIALSVTYPLWRPFPTYIPRVENWTEKYKRGELEVGVPRKEILNKIAAFLPISPILLQGPEGAGKTEAVKCLIEGIERGDFPTLAGSQVFYVNTADLLSHTNWVPDAHSPLSYLSQAIDGQRNKMIFVFDHLHLANKKEGILAEQFMTVLDSPKDYFPKLIGISTPKDKKNLELAHRFHIIDMPRVDFDGTIKILTAIQVKTAPTLIVHPSAYQWIAQKAKNIREAIHTLKYCIGQLAPQFTEERELLWKMKQQMYELSLSDPNGKQFAALNQVIIPKLEEGLIQKATEAGVKIVLDEAFIESLGLTL